MPRKPLILLPGLLCDAALWRHQAEHLTDVADVTVGDLSQDTSMRAMAARVLAGAPPRFCLGGLSMGGYLAFEIMRQAPERVERLALLDTSARPDTPERAETRSELIRLAQTGKFKAVMPRLLPNFIHPSRLKDPAVADVVRQMAERTGPEAFIRQQTAIMGRPDSRGDLASIRVPTLVLCGRQDVLTPLAVHEEIAAGIAGSKLVIVEDCGHLAPLERPEATTAAMRAWLA